MINLKKVVFVYLYNNMEFFSLNSKYKKYHKIKLNGTNRFSTLYFGKVGLIALKNLRLTVSNLKFFFKITKKLLKPFNKKLIVKFRYFPHFSITKKPKDIRMGRGKGIVLEKVCYIKKGNVWIELVGSIDIFVANYILKFLCSKISVPCRFFFIYNND